MSGAPLHPPKLPAAAPKTLPARRKLAARFSPDPTLAKEPALRILWRAEAADLPHPYLEDPETLFDWGIVETSEEIRLAERAQANQRAKRAFSAATECLKLNRETLARSRYARFKVLREALALWQTVPAAKTIAEKLNHDACRAGSPYAGIREPLNKYPRLG